MGNKIELIHGDCLVEMKNIPDKSIDFICCDLPYNILSLEWDKFIPTDDLWKNYNRIIKDNGVIALFGQEPFSSRVRMSNISNYKYDYVWVKTKAANFASCRKVPLRYHENIMIFYNKGITYNLPSLHNIKPIKSGRKNKGSNIGMSGGKEDYLQTQSGFNESVLYYTNKSGKGYSFHPTQKNIDLLEHLIKTYTNEGETVLDNCMGSGTCGIACLNTNRNFIGIEKDDKYFQVAKDRIENHKISNIQFN